MKGRDNPPPEVADPKSLSEIPPNPEPFNLFAGLESQQLQSAELSETQKQPPQQIAQSAATPPPVPLTEATKPGRTMLIALIVVFVIAALIFGILVGYQFSRH